MEEWFLAQTSGSSSSPSCCWLCPLCSTGAWSMFLFLVVVQRVDAHVAGRNVGRGGAKRHRNSSRFLVERLWVAPILLHVLLFLLCLNSFLVASFIDPGIFPRRQKGDAVDLKSSCFLCCVCGREGFDLIPRSEHRQTIPWLEEGGRSSWMWGALKSAPTSVVCPSFPLRTVSPLLKPLSGQTPAFCFALLARVTAASATTASTSLFFMRKRGGQREETVPPPACVLLHPGSEWVVFCLLISHPRFDHHCPWIGTLLPSSSSHSSNPLSPAALSPRCADSAASFSPQGIALEGEFSCSVLLFPAFFFDSHFVYCLHAVLGSFRRRNYRFFILFLTATTIYSFYSFALAITELVLRAYDSKAKTSSHFLVAPNAPISLRHIIMPESSLCSRDTDCTNHSIFRPENFPERKSLYDYFGRVYFYCLPDCGSTAVLPSLPDDSVHDH